MHWVPFQADLSGHLVLFEVAFLVLFEVLFFVEFEVLFLVEFEVLFEVLFLVEFEVVLEVFELLVVLVGGFIKLQKPLIMVKPRLHIHLPFDNIEFKGHEQTLPNLTKVSTQMQARPL